MKLIRRSIALSAIPDESGNYTATHRTVDLVKTATMVHGSLFVGDVEAASTDNDVVDSILDDPTVGAVPVGETFSTKLITNHCIVVRDTMTFSDKPLHFENLPLLTDNNIELRKDRVTKTTTVIDKRNTKTYIAGLGDSLTDFSALGGIMTDDIEASYNIAGLVGGAQSYSPIGYQVLDMGMYGQTTADILARTDQVVAVNPDYVVLCAGVNDLLNGVSIETSIDNMGKILTKLASANIPVCIVPIPNFQNFKQTVDIYNTQLRVMANLTDDCISMLTYKHFIDDKSMLQIDGVHPSTFGGESLGRDIFEHIDKCLQVNYNPTNLVNPFDTSDYENDLPKGWVSVGSGINSPHPTKTNTHVMTSTTANDSINTSWENTTGEDVYVQFQITANLFNFQGFDTDVTFEVSDAFALAVYDSAWSAYTASNLQSYNGDSGGNPTEGLIFRSGRLLIAAGTKANLVLSLKSGTDPSAGSPTAHLSDPILWIEED